MSIDGFTAGPEASSEGGMEVLTRFGENLRRIRQARRLSQEALALRAGIHRTQLTLLEHGERSTGAGTLLKLACALEVSVDMLLEGITFHQVPGGTELRATAPPELPRASVGRG